MKPLIGWVRLLWRKLIGEESSEGSQDGWPADLRATVLGNTWAGKGTLLQWARLDSSEFQDLPGGVRWEQTPGDDPYKRPERMPGTGVPVVELVANVSIEGRAARIRFQDTKGGLLLEERPGVELDPESFPDLYRASYRADLLILTLAPDDLFSPESPRVFSQLVNHVERALLAKSRLMVAVAYSKCDEYAFLSPPRPRLLSRRRHFRALRTLGKGGAEATTSFLDAVVPEGDPRRDLVARSAQLWRQLATILRRGDGMLNGYFLAAGPPVSTLCPGWKQRGLGELMTDFLAHRTHVHGRPRLSWAALALCLVAAVTAFAAGSQQRARAQELAQNTEPALQSEPLQTEPPRSWLLPDLLGRWAALESLEDGIQAAISEARSAAQSSPAALAAPLRAPPAGERAAREFRLLEPVCARGQALHAAFSIAQRCLARFEERPVAAQISAQVEQEWRELDGALVAFEEQLELGPGELDGSLVRELGSAYRDALVAWCDALLLRGHGLERRALLRARALDVLADGSYLPASPYAREDACRLTFGAPCEREETSFKLVSCQAPPGDVSLTVESDDGAWVLDFGSGELLLSTPEGTAAIWECGDVRQFPGDTRALVMRLHVRDRLPLAYKLVDSGPGADADRARVSLAEVIRALKQPLGPALDPALRLEPCGEDGADSLELAQESFLSIARLMDILPDGARHP